MKFQKRIYEILEVATPGDFSSRIFDVSIMSLIVLNVLATIIETIGEIGIQQKQLFYLFEFFSVVIFTIEYLLRIWSCVQNPQFSHPIKGRIRFAFTAMPIIDLLAILPFYLPMIIPIDLRFLRILRLFRIFRVFKMGRYFEAFQMIANVIKAKKEELFITVFMVMIMLIFASSLMYIVENSVQPENFSSIPSAMWWGVATLTTVGYGDVYPITPLGRCLGAIISLLGIGLFALPTGFLASGFAEEVQKRRQQQENVCPHCGRKINK
jgi:voltage-gated potassium channel